MGDGGDREIGRAVPFSMAHGQRMPTQKVDACIRIQEVSHSRISLCFPCGGRLNEAGSEIRIREKKPLGHAAGLMGETIQRSPDASI